MKIILIRYGEVSLRSYRSRSKYEDELIENIKKCLNAKEISFDEIKKERGRIFISGEDINLIAKTVSNLFGVVSASPSLVVNQNLDEIKKACYMLSKDKLKDKSSFAISSRRTKDQNLSTHEINNVVGDFILKKSNDVHVDLDNPDYKINIEVRGEYAYIFDTIYDGPGGLPVGTQGRAIALLSGDVNSFLAMYLILKRGCSVIPIYFESDDFLDNIGKDNIIEILKKIFEYEYSGDRLGYFIGFGSIMRTIESKIDENLRCILCKRTMLKISEKIAQETDTHAICLGENIGKKMKFALANLKMVDISVKTPVLRPLVGLDSNEVINTAKKIFGDISNMKKQTCSLSTKTDLYKDFWKMEVTEEDADLDLFINQAVEKKEKFEF